MANSDDSELSDLVDFDGDSSDDYVPDNDELFSENSGKSPKYFEFIIHYVQYSFLIVLINKENRCCLY